MVRPPQYLRVSPLPTDFDDVTAPKRVWLLPMVCTSVTLFILSIVLMWFFLFKTFWT
jgi:hypothetical protein